MLFLCGRQTFAERAFFLNCGFDNFVHRLSSVLSYRSSLFTFYFSLPSHLRLGDIILHLPFLKFNNKIWYERWMYFSLCKPESRNGALPLYPSIWYYILKSSLEKCRWCGQHKKKTAWDSTNQFLRYWYTLHTDKRAHA